MVIQKNTQCIQCNQNNAVYNYVSSDPLFCKNCAKFGMVKIIQNQCDIIGCHETATHGWVFALSCESHANEKMLIFPQTITTS